MTETRVHVPETVPPGWLNKGMELMLRTPGLQRWVGKRIALLGFTGRRTGTRYTIPISYERTGDRVMMTTKQSRTWWRNLAGGADVEMRLAGQTVTGHATAIPGSAEDVDDLHRYLAERPFDAKAYGLQPGPDGALDLAQIAELAPQLVFIRIRLGRPAGA